MKITDFMLGTQKWSVKTVAMTSFPLYSFPYFFTFTPLISNCLAKDFRLLAALVLWSFWGPSTVTTRALGRWVLTPLDFVNTSNLAISNKMTCKLIANPYFNKKCFMPRKQTWKTASQIKKACDDIERYPSRVLEWALFAIHIIEAATLTYQISITRITWQVIKSLINLSFHIPFSKFQVDWRYSGISDQGCMGPALLYIKTISNFLHEVLLLSPLNRSNVRGWVQSKHDIHSIWTNC